jgi:hypothetical protein
MILTQTGLVVVLALVGVVFVIQATSLALDVIFGPWKKRSSQTEQKPPDQPRPGTKASRFVRALLAAFGAPHT